MRLLYYSTHLYTVLAFFPVGERGTRALITVAARKENEGPGTWALSAVLNFMGCDLVLVGAAGNPVSPLRLGDYDTRCSGILRER